MRTLGGHLRRQLAARPGRPAAQREAEESAETEEAAAAARVAEVRCGEEAVEAARYTRDRLADEAAVYSAELARRRGLLDAASRRGVAAAEERSRATADAASLGERVEGARRHLEGHEHVAALSGQLEGCRDERRAAAAEAARWRPGWEELLGELRGEREGLASRSAACGGGNRLLAAELSALGGASSSSLELGDARSFELAALRDEGRRLEEGARRAADEVARMKGRYWQDIAPFSGAFDPGSPRGLRPPVLLQRARELSFLRSAPEAARECTYDFSLY